MVRPMAVVIAVSLLGCTTMATVEPTAVTDVLAELEAGDRASIRTASGWYEDVTVIETDAARIRGLRRGSPVLIARDDILEIRVPRKAPGKVAALAAGIYLLSLYALCGNPFDEPVTC